MPISTWKLHFPTPPGIPDLPALWISLLFKKGQKLVPILLPGESCALSGRKLVCLDSLFCWNIQLVHMTIFCKTCTKHTVSFFSSHGKVFEGTWCRFSSVTQWYSTCLARMRPEVQSPVLPKRKTKANHTQQKNRWRR